MEWWIWLVLGVAIGIVELSSVTFVLLWFAIAAVVTAVLAPFVHSLWVQLLIFAVISLGLFFATRPLAKKWRRTRTFSTHLETRVGHTGVVVSGAEPGGYATVRIEGELWSATSVAPLRAGVAVIVKDADGAVLKVAPAPDTTNQPGGPSQPGRPSQPDTTNQPGGPSQPGGSSQPGRPSQPDPPGSPDTPVRPGDSGKSANPDSHDQEEVQPS